MEVARNGGQKARIIAEAQKTGTFLALVFASEYLDDKDKAIQQAAAQAVMNIGLEHGEYDGNAVRKLLTRTAEVLEGPDSDYQQKAIQKHLSEMSSGAGFRSDASRVGKECANTGRFRRSAYPY